MSNRPVLIKGSDQVIGNFINTIPLRIKSQEGASFLDLVTEVNQSLINRNQFHDSSLHEINQAIGLQASKRLFDSVVGIENYPLDEQLTDSVEGLEIKLKNYQRQLEKLQPKTKDKTGKSVPFDEVVLGYGVVTGLMFKTNQITQSEYRALINVGNQKMEAIEKSIGKNGKR